MGFSKTYKEPVKLKIPLAECKRQCVHYGNSGVFEQCFHDKSEYKENERTEYHTIQHMRLYGECGSEMILVKKRENLP